MRTNILVVTVCLLLSPTVFCVERLQVLALFPGKALLVVDGQRKVLAVGDTGPGGVELVEANSRFAVVRVDGVERELRLGSTVSSSYAKPQAQVLRLVSDATGSFYTDGLINGQPVRFLVDTGATTVAISQARAVRLGLEFGGDRSPVPVGTASGSAIGHPVQLRQLKIGNFNLSNVSAVVIEGDSPRNVLLGMNVLGQFDIKQKDKLMTISR